MTGKVDYHAYIASEEWAKKSQATKERAGHRCQICNVSDSEATLEAHHRTYERLGNELPDDLTVLCEVCHALYSRYAKLAKHGKESIVLGNETKMLLDVPQEPSPAFPTNLSNLAGLLHNTHPGDLILLTSVSGMGKTSLLIELARTAAFNFDKSVLFLSLQQNAGKIAERILLGAAAKNYEHASPRLMINDSVITDPDQIMGICLEQAGFDLLIIDGLEMMVSAQNQWERDFKFAELLRQIKLVAQQFDVPALASAPVLSKNPINRSDRRPFLATDVHESIQSVCDVILALYRDDFYNPEDSERPNLIEIGGEKSRNNAAYQSVELYWRPETATFSQPEKREIDL